MQTEARPRIASRVGAGSGREGLKSKGKQRWIYTRRWTLACSLRVRSSSDGLGRPRGLGSHWRPITRIGNRGFPMQAFRLIFYHIKDDDSTIADCSDIFKALVATYSRKSSIKPIIFLSCWLLLVEH